ncbi:MAG: CDP-alcohol phosphatidyltransferase family protein [Spirochaetales bacterium]|nr:CDP-alcohol phosphatidyltransferase family protein [Spirochaetales bacterium]
MTRKNGKKHNRFMMMLPNLLTLANALAGFTALLIFFFAAWRGEILSGLVLSGWFVLFAVVFDGLDGFTARKLDAASSTGLQLDSLADVITFGLTPAVILGFVGLASGFPGLRVLLPISAGFYLCCAVWRLAVYNVMALEGGSSSSFRGLPVPGAAAGIVSTLVLAGRQGMSPLLLGFMALYALAAGALMISRLSYLHMWKWFVSERRGLRYLITAVFFFSLAIILGPMSAVVVFSFLYLLSGPLGPVLEKISRLAAARRGRPEIPEEEIEVDHV